MNPPGVQIRSNAGGPTRSPVDPATVVDPLHDDYLFSGGQCREQAKVPHAKFAFFGADQLLEIVIRVGCCTLQAIDDPASDGSIQGPEITNRRVGPLNLPRRQRPNRFLTRS